VFLQSGPALIVAATVIVVLTALLGYWFGRRVLRMPPVLLLGALMGAMTSAPALSTLTSESRNAVSALGYTGRYAFANVILTIAGRLVMLI
jgi:putative transport protein